MLNNFVKKISLIAFLLISISYSSPLGIHAQDINQANKEDVVVVNSLVGDITPLEAPISYSVTGQDKYKIKSTLYNFENFQLNINKTVLEEITKKNYSDLKITWTSNLRQMYMNEDMSEIVFNLNSQNNPYVELTIEDLKEEQSDINYYMLIDSIDYSEEIKNNANKTRAFIIFLISFVVGPIAAVYFFAKRNSTKSETK